MPPGNAGDHITGVTSDEDVRQIEELLGMPPKTISAPLWGSGDLQRCPNYRSRQMLLNDTNILLFDQGERSHD